MQVDARGQRSGGWGPEMLVAAGLHGAGIVGLDLPGPSRRIRVEPIKLPDPTVPDEPRRAPEPPPEPEAPPPEPDPQPVREPEPDPQPVEEPEPEPAKEPERTPEREPAPT